MLLGVPFYDSRHTFVENVGDWILSCSDIEGVTFSSGEPFQQAPDLLELCEYVKTRGPDFSIGLFSGYTMRELVSGRWQYRSGEDSRWYQGRRQLVDRIRDHLDFGIFGRFSPAQATSDKPLCGSRNQEVVFFTERYSERDLQPQACEVNISHDGEEMTITGFPTEDFLKALTAE
jgi:anaerobic ribonucleoside-triphosphate reductase activating protein